MKTKTISYLTLILGGAIGFNLSAQTGGAGSGGAAGGGTGGTGATAASGATAGDGAASPTGATSATGTTTTNGMNTGAGTSTGANGSATGTQTTASSAVGSGSTSGVSTNTVTIPGGATIPAATTGAVPTATANEIPAPTTGSLPAQTDLAMPNTATDVRLNRATVSADARALNTPSASLNSTTADTARVSPGTTPIGPQPLSTAAATATADQASPIRRAADPVLTPTGNLPNAASRPGEAIDVNPVRSVVVSTPPPAAEREARTPSPGADQVWVPGHYTYANGQWIWIKGVWSTPPQNDTRWVEGTYDQATRRWTEGHWDFGNQRSARKSSR